MCLSKLHGLWNVLPSLLHVINPPSSLKIYLRYQLILAALWLSQTESIISSVP